MDLTLPQREPESPESRDPGTETLWREIRRKRRDVFLHIRLRRRSDSEKILVEVGNL